MSRPGLIRVAVAAIRPATLSAAVAPVAVGSALAAADGALRPAVAICALLGAVFIQVGTNLFNDWADFKKGADTDARLGPARATQRGWLRPGQVLGAACTAFALAALFGVYLIAVGGWPILLLGLVSIACGFAYTGGPYPLGYHGLGDVFVLLFFGIAAVCGTYWLQAGSLDLRVLMASLSVGALTTAIIVVNNLRDRHTDAVAGKRTLAVRFGERFARYEYLLLLLAGYALPATLWIAGRVDAGWLLPWLSLPLALQVLSRFWTRDGAALNPLLGGTAKLGLCHAALLSVGVLL